ncbi:hypothetical protein SPRG_07646 [Saprolegnia parasitica CBS 223.65]|uniref:Uncharacterized protein n=1 Tax=Saprolegnia parasitica (strain CBS 223.65) TaxID=695850 RepID=A0A067CJE2_SAPPC|nr:hypothetical protein SPRG_07646 [Saprolegnia parasitica CBS 223.65]KDO26932.1 hypothetical protein SPRG_07646 [Saprolegnia parasitica CBS 223.65]|eukprot:XP_012202314.1 hypothetical protein SPRG_07646 [Saprolegnia parasitica CBS 223.65]
MSTTKLSCPGAATMLSLPHVLTSIAQCLQSPDALVFLSALPLTSLDTALAATKELLTRPGRFVHTWPQVDLEEINDDDEPLVRAALPAILSVHAYDIYSFAPLSATTDCESVTPFLEFAVQYPLKMTHVDGIWQREVGTSAFCSFLRRCTRLTSIDLTGIANAADLLAAVLTPTHRVSSLVIGTTYDSTDGDDWTALLLPWLASGHARHALNNWGRRPIPDIAGLARALATSSSLQGLDIINYDLLLAALVALKMPLRQLTALNVMTILPAYKMLSLLELLDLAKLTSLTLDLHGTDTSHWPHLESLSFNDVELPAETVDAVLAYLGRVQGLQKLTMVECSMVGTCFFDVSRALSRLVANGLTFASFHHERFDDMSAALVALVLHEGRNVSPLKLCLWGNDITIKGVRVLLEALATCTYVCVQIEPCDFSRFSPHKDEIQAFAAAHRMVVESKPCTLYSPSTTS